MIQHFNVVNTFLARLWRGGVLRRNKKVFKPFYQEIVLLIQLVEKASQSFAAAAAKDG